MSDFLQLAQTLAMALKALQMYTSAHPRAQAAVAATHAALDTWLAGRDRLQFVVTGSKAFADGVVQDGRNPHVAALVRLVAERGVSGFVFERGVTAPECLAFLQGLSLKPQKVEALGGIEYLLEAADVRHIKVSQIRYQVVREGEEGDADDRPPASQALPSDDPLMKAIREALLAALSGLGTGNQNGLGSSPILGEGMPTPAQLDLLRRVLASLEPKAQLSLVAALASLPERPSGLALGVKALAGDLLGMAAGAALASGISWEQLRGPLEQILSPLPDRDALVRALAAHLQNAGGNVARAEDLLRRMDWESLSLEAKLVKVLEEDRLFELTLAQRLAFLRELLDLRRFGAFLMIQEILTDALRDDRPDIRLKAAQTLTGVTRWVIDPGLPPTSEGALTEALRAHFAWEPDSPIHHWTTEALDALLSALVARGDMNHVISDFRDLEGLCVFHGDPQPWRKEAMDRLRGALARPETLEMVIGHILSLDRSKLAAEVHPFLEFLGAPMARYLVARLEQEDERTRRGRLVEAVRSLGPLSLPPLLEALDSPAWYLVRNALTLLSDLGDAGCLSAAAPLLRHVEPRVRRAAVRALWKLGGPASEPHLVARMKDTDPETLHEILFALAQLRSEGSVQPVAEAARDKRLPERLRVQAIETLAQIASPRALPELSELLRRGFFSAAEPQPIRMAAARAMASLGTFEAREALNRVIESEPRGADRDHFRDLLDRRETP